MVAAQDTSQQAFPHMDWRFNEFPNQATHGLYVTCVELLVLPLEPALVGEKLVDVILQVIGVKYFSLVLELTSRIVAGVP